MLLQFLLNISAYTLCMGHWKVKVAFRSELFLIMESWACLIRACQKWLASSGDECEAIASKLKWNPKTCGLYMFFFLQQGIFRFLAVSLHPENCRTGHHSVSRMFLLQRGQFAVCILISWSVYKLYVSMFCTGHVSV